MEKFGSLDEVLDFAIDREIEANQFYLALAKRTDNPAMCRVFEDFAKEELGHKAKLEAMKKGKNTLATNSAVDLKIADYIVDIEPGDDMNYSDTLIIAMKKEKASFHLYTDLAAEVENKDQREVFLALAKEEANHKLRFELEYDNIVLKEN